jgi:hypothetical protein
MDMCVTLGLLVSELIDDLWCDHVITFSKLPELHRIADETLTDKVTFVCNLDWGMNTNLRAVFNKILEVAAEALLAPEQMVKRQVRR